MRLLIPTLLLLLFSNPAMAAEDRYYISPRDGVDLRLTPNNNAKVSGHLSRKTDVKIIDSRRNWRKVRSLDHKGLVGWIPEGAIRKRYEATTTKKRSSFLSGFSALFRSPEPAQKTAVLGVRGLEDEGAANADQATEQANKAVKWMDTLNVPDREVAAFIDEGNLNP